MLPATSVAPALSRDALSHAPETDSLPPDLAGHFASLQQQARILQDILAVDVWALAKTMDDFEPGFWAAFMKNRSEAMRRFIETRARRDRQGIWQH